MPHVSLSLRDLSFGGLSAMSEQPMEAGERVAVFFPPQGGIRGWDAYGRIIRCDPAASDIASPSNSIRSRWRRESSLWTEILLTTPSSAAPLEGAVLLQACE